MSTVDARGRGGRVERGKRKRRKRGRKRRKDGENEDGRGRERGGRKRQRRRGKRRRRRRRKRQRRKKETKKTGKTKTKEEEEKKRRKKETKKTGKTKTEKGEGEEEHHQHLLSSKGRVFDGVAGHYSFRRLPKVRATVRGPGVGVCVGGPGRSSPTRMSNLYEFYKYWPGCKVGSSVECHSSSGCRCKTLALRR